MDEELKLNEGNPEKEQESLQNSEEVEKPSELTVEDIANMSEEEVLNNSFEDLIKNSSTNAEDASKEEVSNKLEESENQEKAEEPQTEEIDFSDPKNFVDYVTKPFRANKSTVQVTDPEEVVKFMQMGLNYQKKLNSIRPHLGAVKALESAELLEDEKLNHLIEVAQGNPQAIAELIKQHDIDVYSLSNDDEEKPYEAGSHVPSASEVEFSEVVQELNTDNHGLAVMNVIKDWDDASKGILYDSPELMYILKEHSESGLFQDTLGILEKEAALGNLKDSNIIEAYNTVATQLMNQQNAPSSQEQVGQRPNVDTNLHSNQQQPQIVGTNIPTEEHVVNNSTKANAAIPNGGANPNAPVDYINPVTIANMSEEDLAKYGTFEEFIQKNNFQFR